MFSRRTLLQASSLVLPVLFSVEIARADDLDLDWSSQVIRLRNQSDTRTSPVVTAVRIQPIGTYLATAGDDHIVRIWNIASGELVHRLDGHGDWVRAVAFSPDGSILATAGNDRKIWLWDIQTGNKQAMLAEHDQAITDLQYSHNGRLLAAAGFEDTLHVYDTESGRLLHRLGCPCRDMRAVAFSPDDQLLAAGGRNGKIRIYRCETGQAIRDLAAHQQRIHKIQFTHDGRQIVSCGEDRVVRVSDVEGDQSFALPQRPAKVLTMAIYSPGRLATAGTDNVICLWNLETRQEIGQLTGHTGSVATMESNQNILVSGGYDTTVRVWKMQQAVAEEFSQPPKRVGTVSLPDFE